MLIDPYKINDCLSYLKAPQIMAPLTDAAKMIQEAEESGKSLLEVSASVMTSTKFESWKANDINSAYLCMV